MSLLVILVGATSAGVGGALGYAVGFLPDRQAPGWVFVAALVMIVAFVTLRTPMMVAIHGLIHARTLSHRRAVIRALGQMPFETLRALGPDALRHRIIDLGHRATESALLIAQGWQVVARVLAAFILIAMIAPTVFLALTGIALAMTLGLALATQRMLAHERVIREAQERTFEGMAEMLRGFKTLKLNPALARDFHAAELAGPSDAAARAGRAAGRLLATTTAMTNAVRFALVALVLVLGPHLGDGTVAPEALGAVALIVAMPLYVLDQTPVLARAMEARRALEAFTAEVRAAARPPASPVATEPPPPATFTGLDTLDLVYRYRDPTATAGFTLGPLSCRIEPGTVTFIVGGNGSGKTTMLTLLVGLMPPASGAILLNGRPADAEARAALCSVVFADPVLFSRAYGLSPARRARLAPLLEDLGLPRALGLDADTLHPQRVSMGQRKRIALALALLEDRPLLLLDEVAADQDPAFRQRFYRDLLPRLTAEGRTIVAVSHDDRWFHVADQIIHLDSGRRVGPGADAAAS
ncbi:ATP-binding cassette domain-containing protein [Roseospira visakhapatnamensis]|uniref:Putative ATP-binding cassette transporter n=1 Tax=Roseospira visakhapatnamensis TaxID=390880 RepID=A0A7W6R9X8_9PROT|nr:putative ATP-binding cassette transporter [Roseospira visakhapatnamensis]